MDASEFLPSEGAATETPGSEVSAADRVLQVLAVIQNLLRKCDAYIGTLPDSKIRDFEINRANLE